MTPPPKPLRTALLQGPRGLPRSTAQSVAALEAAARRAADAGARLLVASEMYLTGYALGARVAQAAESADGPGARAVARVAAEHALAVVYGYPERGEDGVYNSVQLVGPDGARLANYRKTHLYGDFETASFVPGDTPVVQADLDGVRVGLLVCYDVEFPEAVRAHALAGTELLAVPTALMRPHELVAGTIVPARAFENQLHIAYANRCGDEGGGGQALTFAGLSCLAAPDGTVRARAGAGDDLVVADVDPALSRTSRGGNPYLRDRRPELYASLV